MKRRTALWLAVAAAAALAAQPALADWPTTSFLPVPAFDKTPHDVTDDEFEEFAAEGELGETGEGVLNRGDGARVVDVTDLDTEEMRRDATGALTDVMRLAAIDASLTEAAEFPEPLIEPVIRVDGGGKFYPLFWAAPEHTGHKNKDGPFTAAAWQPC